MLSHCNKQEIVQRATAQWDNLACLVMHSSSIVTAQWTHTFFDFWAQQALKPTRQGRPAIAAELLKALILAEAPKARGPALQFGVIQPTLVMHTGKGHWALASFGRRYSQA